MASEGGGAKVPRSSSHLTATSTSTCSWSLRRNRPGGRCCSRLKSCLWRTRDKRPCHPLSPAPRGVVRITEWKGAAKEAVGAHSNHKEARGDTKGAVIARTKLFFWGYNVSQRRGEHGSSLGQLPPFHTPPPNPQHTPRRQLCSENSQECSEHRDKYSPARCGHLTST